MEKYLKIISVTPSYLELWYPLQVPQHATFDQCLHSLLTGTSVQNTVKVNIFTRDP